MIFRWCPQKWTNAKINILICNANKSDVSTKVDKLKERAQINIEDSKAVSTKVDKLKQYAQINIEASKGVSTKVDRQ